jgi:hypothetical protein
MKTLTLFTMMKKHLMGMAAFSVLFMFFSPTASAQANLSLFTPNTIVNVGQTFTVEVRVDLNQGTNTQLDVAEAYLNFDPAYLQVQSITNGSTLGFVLLSTFNNTPGTVDYAAGTFTAPITADFTLLTITFKAIDAPPLGSTVISFNTVLPRKTDAFRTGNSILGTTTNLTITIVEQALPITLTDFKGSSQENNIILNWTTATENNNKGFEIQRSQDGTNWTILGFVNGAGNSNQERKYTYTDNNLVPHLYHYRLKQVDQDGKFEYSRIVTIKLQGSKVFELGQNWPNPFRGKTFVSFNLAEKRRVTLTLFDTRGKLIKTLLNETREAGNHVIDLNLQTLPGGVYYYKIVAGDFTDVKKMIVR